MRRLSALAPSPGAPGVFVVDDGTSHVYVERDDDALACLPATRLADLLAGIEEPVLWAIDFSDVALCRRVIEALADDAGFTVDNDHGVILPGSEYVRRMRERPDWDWRSDVDWPPRYGVPYRDE